MSTKKNCFSVFLIFGALLAIGLKIPAAQAKMNIEPRFKAYNATNAHLDLNTLGFNKEFDQGGQIAVGDLTGDGKDEIVLGSGSGRSSEIKVFSGKGAFLNWTVKPFAADFKGGVDVAVADVDGDGLGDIVAAQHITGQGYIKIYKYSSKKVINSFRSFPNWFSGGINIAAGDVTGDSKAEIIVGTELKNTARVRVFSKGGTLLNQEFYPYGTNYTGGVDVAVGDVVAGGKKELVTAANSDAVARIKTYSLGSPNVKSETQSAVPSQLAYADASVGTNSLQLAEKQQERLVQIAERLNAQKAFAATLVRERLLNEFVAFGEGFKGGANVAVVNVDATADAEIVVGKNAYKSASVAVYSYIGQKKSFDVTPYDSIFEGGVQVAAGDLDGGAAKEIVVFPTLRPRLATRTDWNKYVEVNLSEQRHYVYEDGILVNTSLISSGKTGPTFTGDFAVSQRQFSKLYAGAGFYLPNTLWNMRYDGPRFLHGAYWHNNFGHPMSHGCVNMPYPDAEYLFNNSELGLRVWVHR